MEENNNQDILNSVTDEGATQENNPEKKKKIVFIVLGIFFLCACFLFFIAPSYSQKESPRSVAEVASTRSMGNPKSDFVFEFEEELQEGKKENPKLAKPSKQVQQAKQAKKEEKEEKEVKEEREEKVIVEIQEAVENNTNETKKIVKNKPFNENEVLRAYEEAISPQDAIKVIEEKIQNLGKKVKQTVKLFKEDSRILLLDSDDRKTLLKKILEKDKKQLQILNRSKNIMKDILLKQQGSTGGEVDSEIEELLNIVDADQSDNSTFSLD